MCGITGIWGGCDEQLTREMMKTMVHRGPDGSGTANWDLASLGHRRLAIMDPAKGTQPLHNETGSLAAAANGEIYNFHRLKDRLIEAGHGFATASDSEVPVHLFEQMGTGCAAELDGMFSFALTDGQEFFAARDTVGIKPLYYGTRGSQTLFASELKALAGKADRVEEFPPGWYYHSQTGFQPFRELSSVQPQQDMDSGEAVRRIRSTLEESITKRLMSDVPLGAFLSGGLDSSIIAAVARQHLDQLHTFSVGTEGSADLAAARVVAKHIDSIHHEYILTEKEIRCALPEVVYYLESFDQDLVRSAVPCWFVSKLASEHVKVILTGEGADELFGGYTYYKDFSETMPLDEELYRSICSLHNINLQRVDRMTMAHSIEGRVPFLDEQMIELGQQIPSHLKILRDRKGGSMEKWVLRKAFEDLLPPEIVWRSKEQFDEGSGSVDILDRMGSWYLPRREAEAYARTHASRELRSSEECAYHKLLSEAYAEPDIVLDNVARWQADRLVTV